MRQPKKVVIQHIHAFIGDADEYCKNDVKHCANKECTKSACKKHVVSLYQHGMFEDIVVEVWQCKTCLECTSFKYLVEHHPIGAKG